MPALNLTITAGRVVPYGLERGSVIRLVNELLAELRGPGPRSMLEIGVGAGLYSQQLRRMDLLNTVTDVGQLGFEIPGAARCFDLVLISGLLEFLEDAEELFMNLCGRVGPAGKLVAIFPRAGLIGKLHRFERRAMTGMDVRLIPPSWLEELANECGLSLQTTRTPIPHRMVMAFERLARA